MRFILFIILYLFSAAMACMAQDILIKRNGDELKVKVLEITETEIKYRLFDDQDGPLRTIGKGDVFMIKYVNGSKEVFEETNSTASPNAGRESDFRLFRITENNREYYLNGKPLEYDQLVKIIKNSNNPEAYDEILKGKAVQKGKSLTTTGIVLMGAGVFSFFGGIMLSDVGSSSNEYVGVVIGVLGFFSTVAGPGFLIPGLIIQNSGRKHISKAVQLYNRGRGTP